MKILVQFTGNEARPYISGRSSFGVPHLLKIVQRAINTQAEKLIDPSDGLPWAPSDDIYTNGHYTVAINAAEHSVSLVDAPPGETLAYLVEWQKKSGKPAQVWAM